jgi:hypothetical protein
LTLTWAGRHPYVGEVKDGLWVIGGSGGRGIMHGRPWPA